MPRAKKVVNEKNWFLHARQLREGIFDVSSNSYCIFTIEFFNNFKYQIFCQIMSRNMCLSKQGDLSILGESLHHLKLFAKGIRNAVFFID